MNEIKKYTIGQVSKKYKIPITSIRYYEKRGLLTPMGQDRQGNRLFSDANLKRVFAIIKLREANLTVSHIKDYFEVQRDNSKTIEEKKNIVLNKKDEIESQIDSLKLIQEYLMYKEWYYDKALEIGVDKLELNLDSLTPKKFKDIAVFISSLKKEYN